MNSFLYLAALFGLLMIGKWLACLKYENDYRQEYERRVAARRSEQSAHASLSRVPPSADKKGATGSFERQSSQSTWGTN